MISLSQNRWVASIALICFTWMSFHAYAEPAAFKWPGSKGGGPKGGGGGGGTKEFFSQNLEDLETVRIHLWGDVPAPGIYYVPRETTLRTIMGYVGGPPNVPVQNTEISLSRITKSQSKEGKTMVGAKHFKLTALDILEQPKWSLERIEDGDVIFIYADRPSNFSIFEFLKDLLFVLGFVTTSVSTILLLQQLNKR